MDGNTLLYRDPRFSPRNDFALVSFHLSALHLFLQMQSAIFIDCIERYIAFYASRLAEIIPQMIRLKSVDQSEPLQAIVQLFIRKENSAYGYASMEVRCSRFWATEINDRASGAFATYICLGGVDCSLNDCSKMRLQKKGDPEGIIASANFCEKWYICFFKMALSDFGTVLKHFTKIYPTSCWSKWRMGTAPAKSTFGFQFWTVICMNL